MLGLSKGLIASGRVNEARDILNNFPLSREFQTANKLKIIIKAISDNKDIDHEVENPINRTYNHALKLIELGNLQAAMDGVLEVLRKDKYFKQGEAKRVILGIFEILGTDNPITRQYQNELASVLF